MNDLPVPGSSAVAKQRDLAPRRIAGIHPNLLDVTLVLVLIFQLTSMLARSGSNEMNETTLPPIHLPKLPAGSERAEAESANDLVVTIDAGGKLFVEDQPLSQHDLREHLARTNFNRVEIRGDNRVFYGRIMEVLRLCQDCGTEQINLSFEPQNQ